MVEQCNPRIYQPQSSLSELSSIDKPLALLGLYRNSKLPPTSTSGGIFAEYTYQPWFIYYIHIYICIYIYVYVCIYTCCAYIPVYTYTFVVLVINIYI